MKALALGLLLFCACETKGTPSEKIPGALVAEAGANRLDPDAGSTGPPVDVRPVAGAFQLAIVVPNVLERSGGGRIEVVLNSLGTRRVVEWRYTSRALRYGNVLAYADGAGPSLRAEPPFSKMGFLTGEMPNITGHMWREEPAQKRFRDEEYAFTGKEWKLVHQTTQTRAPADGFDVKWGDRSELRGPLRFHDVAELRAERTLALELMERGGKKKGPFGLPPDFVPIAWHAQDHAFIAAGFRKSADGLFALRMNPAKTEIVRVPVLALCGYERWRRFVAAGARDTKEEHCEAPIVTARTIAIGKDLVWSDARGFHPGDLDPDGRLTHYDDGEIATAAFGKRVFRKEGSTFWEYPVPRTPSGVACDVEGGIAPSASDVWVTARCPNEPSSVFVFRFGRPTGEASVGNVKTEAP